MPQQKNHEDILSQCERLLKNDISSFYRQPLVNYRGITRDTRVPITECIAEWLVNNHLDSFSSIEKIERVNSYNQDHLANGIYFSHNPGAQSSEKTIAKRLYLAGREITKKENSNNTTIVYAEESSQGKKYEFGYLLDFEVPLNAFQNSHKGDIDLLSVDDDTKSVYILELKRPCSEETMLRCVLEGYTYLCTVEKDKLFKDYKIPDCYTLRAAPLVFTDCRAYKEYQDIENRPQLKKLMDKLDIKPFFLDINNEEVRTTIEYVDLLSAHKNNRGKAGSQIDLQVSVESSQSELSKLILCTHPEGSQIQWFSPTRDTEYKEYADRSFWEGRFNDNNNSFWNGFNRPDQFWGNGGPKWDGVAVITDTTGKKTLVLVEAKAHKGEMNSTCRASQKSLHTVKKQLEAAKQLVGSDTTNPWTKRYYQNANRIAFGALLNERGIDTEVVFVLFANDPYWKCDLTTRTCWESTIKEANAYLGVTEEHLLSHGVRHIIIDLDSSEYYGLRTKILSRLHENGVKLSEDI